MDKKSLGVHDIRTKFIAPAVRHAAYDVMTQIREEFSVTKGHIIICGKLVNWGKTKWPSPSFRLHSLLIDFTSIYRRLEP